MNNKASIQEEVKKSLNPIKRKPIRKQILILLTILTISCGRDKIQNDYIGFPVSDFGTHGFNTELFLEYMDYLSGGLYGNINSIIVIHEDELIKEEYFRGWERNDLIQIQSSTKSIASLLIGYAIENNKLSLDDKMVNFFDEYEIQNLDPLKSSITIENMLTMSAGFDWNETDSAYGTSGNSLTDMYNTTENFIPYLLNLPMSDIPGERFVYNSGVSYLLGAILEIATGEQVENYTTTNLLIPLNIPKSQWIAYNDGGLAHCGGGLFLRPIDMAKIGSLVLNKGKWNGKQISSENWINESVKSHIRIDDRTEYGYQWWIYKPPFNMQNFYMARGYGWRNIIIVPELDMVIVITGDNTTNSTVFSEIQFIFDILSCAPEVNMVIINLYEQQINNPRVKLLSDEDIISLAKYLNRYKEYQKTIKFLKLFENDINYEFNYTYHLGNAYFNVNNYDSAKIYLEKHLTFGDRDTPYLQYYFDKATEMLEIINAM